MANRWRNRTAALALIVSVALLTGGCMNLNTPAEPSPASTPTQDPLLDLARETYDAFRGSVSSTQAHLADEAWQVGAYGDEPMSCGTSPESFQFRLERYFPPIEGGEWRLPSAPATVRDDFASWLEGEGWKVTDVRDLQGDISRSSVTAVNTEAGVDELIVDFIPGQAFDSIKIAARSACVPGSDLEVFDLMFTGSRGQPALEKPSDVPWFGSQPGDADLEPAS